MRETIRNRLTLFGLNTHEYIHYMLYIMMILIITCKLKHTYIQY